MLLTNLSLCMSCSLLRIYIRSNEQDMHKLKFVKSDALKFCLGLYGMGGS